MSYRSQKGVCAGYEEDDDNGDEVNGDEVNGDVLQRHVATQNGTVLILAVYNW